MVRTIGWVALLVLGSLAVQGAPRASEDFGRSERVVTEGEWAADLVEALGLTPALPEDPSGDDLFSLLCPDRAELVTQAGGRTVPGRSALRAAAESAHTCRVLGSFPRASTRVPSPDEEG